MERAFQNKVGIAILAVLVLAGAWVASDRGVISANYPELEELAASEERSFQDYSDYFQKLSEDKGAEYAYQVLLRAKLPPGLDLHLLGHVVGDMLYKQKGIAGINSCTDAFRNACSHSVVIGILNDEGESALPEIAQTCKKAPGGKGAYTMCFHGLGHGVLAFNGYDFEKAVQMCEKTGTPEFRDREYIECVGGATMEMVAGVHDRDAWQRQVPNYFKKTDRLYPCDADFMPAAVQPICYIHLTPYLFMSAGASLADPDPKYFPTAFSYCAALPENGSNREACYGGFGKEFVVLANSRDIRNIGSSSDESLQKIREWCAFAGDLQGEANCNGNALSSLFWGGENDSEASLRFCELAPVTAQDDCYNQLAGHIGYYLQGTGRAGVLCSRLPEAYRAKCGMPFR